MEPSSSDASSEHTQATPGGDRGSQRGSSYLEKAFTLLLSPEIEDPTHQLLELVGREMGVSRTYIFRFREGGRVMDNTHEWCAPGVSREIHRLQNLPTDAFLWWMKKLRSGDGVIVPDVSLLPDEARSERATLEAQGIRAVLVLPLLDKIGRLEGFLGFDDVEGTRHWAQAEIASLRLICRLGMREIERERAARAIRRLEARLLLTERLARIGGWEIDPATGLSWWSQQTYDLLGKNPSTSPLTPDDLIQSLAPRDQPRVREAITTALREGAAFRLECRSLTSKGAQPAVLELQAELRGIDDSSSVLFGTVQDITARVLMEQEVRQSRTLDAVGQLAGGIAHDFNNLLAVILGSSRFLLDELGDDAPLRADVHQIRDAADRGAVLVRQLLAFGRRQLLDPELLDLPAYLEGLRRMLQHLVGPDIEIVIDTERDPGPVQVDRIQFEQILLNLCANARDAMNGGGSLRLRTDVRSLDVSVSLAAGQTLAAGDYALLHIEDEGHGMSEATLARIFEPFFSTKTPDRGSGLGLASVFGILQQSGGGIEVESTPDVGSRFTLHLPTGRLPAEPSLPSMEQGAHKLSSFRRANRTLIRASPPLTATSQTASQKGVGNLLIGENNPAVRRTLSRILTRQGYHVVCAGTCAEALTHLEGAGGSNYDLLLTTIDPPAELGRSLAFRFRERNPGSAVIFMTADSTEFAVHSEFVEPRDHLIAKPLPVPALLELVRRLLDLESAWEQPGTIPPR